MKQLIAILLLSVAACGDVTDTPQQPGGGGKGDRTGVCSPENCNGCCTASGQCVPGTAALTCGSGGQACTQCGAADLCEAQQCTYYGNVLSEHNRWLVTIKAPYLHLTDCGGGVVSDACDPYVQVKYATTIKTEIQYDVDGAVTWPNAFYMLSWEMAGATLAVTVYDSDAVVDDTLGSCFVQITANDLVNGFKEFDCAKVLLQFDLRELGAGEELPEGVPAVRDASLGVPG